MNGRRIRLIALAGAAVVGGGWWTAWRTEAEDMAALRRAFAADAERTTAHPGWAPVMLCGATSAASIQPEDTAKVARFCVRDGEVFVEERHMPRERIADWLNARVAAGEIDYVLVTSEARTAWGSVVAVLDACRQSRVRAVLLNQWPQEATAAGG